MTHKKGCRMAPCKIANWYETVSGFPVGTGCWLVFIYLILDGVGQTRNFLYLIGQIVHGSRQICHSCLEPVVSVRAAVCNIGIQPDRGIKHIQPIAEHIHCPGNIHIVCHGYISSSDEWNIWLTCFWITSVLSTVFCTSFMIRKRT